MPVCIRTDFLPSHAQVCLVIDYFNRVAQWTACLILSESTLANRVKLMKCIITIAARLRELNNYHLMTAMYVHAFATSIRTRTLALSTRHKRTRTRIHPQAAHTHTRTHTRKRRASFFIQVYCIDSFLLCTSSACRGCPTRRCCGSSGRG